MFFSVNAYVVVFLLLVVVIAATTTATTYKIGLFDPGNEVDVRFSQVSLLLKRNRQFKHYLNK